MQDLPRIFTVRDSLGRAYKTDESGERIIATGKKLGRPSKPGSLQMRRPAGLPKVTWLDKRKEWEAANDTRKAEIEAWFTNWSPHGPRVVVSPAVAGPVNAYRPTPGYYRQISDHLMDHLKPAVPSVDVDYWPKFNTVQETCDWMVDVSINPGYAEPAAAVADAGDSTWDECYEKMQSFDDSLFKMNSRVTDPGDDGMHAAPG